MKEENTIETIIQKTQEAWEFLMMLEKCPIRNEDLINRYRTKWATLDDLCNCLNIKANY